MDEGTRDWLTKIEAQLNGLNNMTIEKLSSITTKLDIYLPKQTDQENRINKLEDIDIMFLRRTREERRKQREEGYQQAIQEVSEWNSRRLEAEARGEAFTEPPPEKDTVKPQKKKRFIFF